MNPQSRTFHFTTIPKNFNDKKSLPNRQIIYFFTKTSRLFGLNIVCHDKNRVVLGSWNNIISRLYRSKFNKNMKRDPKIQAAKKN